MDHKTTNDRLPEIVDYLRANPTSPATTGGEGSGGQHVHIHHHYAAPPPPPPPPKQTFAEQAVPWIFLGLGACIILTICGLFLAVALIAVVIGLLAMVLFAAVLAFLIKTIRESQINTDAARAGRTRRSR